MNDQEDYLLHVEALKTAGNAAFQKGDMTDAILQYSSAIDLQPDNHILFSNRSAAHMKANNISKALKDAERCVELMPSWVKGYNRLGVAQQGLRRFEQALATFKKGLELDPSSVALRDAITSCEAACEEDKKAQAAHAKQAALREQKAEAERKAMVEKENAKRASHRNDAHATEDDNSGIDESRKDRQVDTGEADDVLGDFFSSVDEAVVEVESEDKNVSKKGDFHQKYLDQDLGTGTSQYSRLTAKNFEFRNLNPYLVLQLDIDATEEDIKQRYRKLSSKVHPDKLRNVENARLAFEQVNAAYKALQDEDHKRNIIRNIETVRAEAERTYPNSGDAASTLKEYAEKAVMRYFADVEMARRRSEQLQRAYSAREKFQAEEERDSLRHEAEREKNWNAEGRSEKRLHNWKDFQGGVKKRQRS